VLILAFGESLAHSQPGLIKDISVEHFAMTEISPSWPELEVVAYYKKCLRAEFGSMKGVSVQIAQNAETIIYKNMP